MPALPCLNGKFTDAMFLVWLVFATGCSGGGGGNDAAPQNKPGVPQSPVNLTAVPGNNQVTLTWDKVSGASAYNLYWSTAPAASSALSRDTANAVLNVTPGYIHQSLTNGQSYYYIVTAANGGGESLPSTEIMAIPGGQLIADVVTDVNLQHCLSSLSTATPAYADTLSGELDCSYRGIAAVTGLQYLTGLTSILLAGNTIQDLSPLNNLLSLTRLDVSHNQLSHDSETVLTRLLQYGSLSQLSLAGNNQLSCAFIDTVVAQSIVTDVTASEPGVNCSVYEQSPVPSGSLLMGTVKALPGDAKVTLMWEEISGAVDYTVYWSTASGVTPASENKISGVHPPYVHLGLNNGTQYYYVIAASNGVDEGPVSDEVFAVPSNQGTLIDNVFTDANLQACVNQYAAGKGWTFVHEITGYLDCSSRSITSLQGMEQLPELTQLNVMNNAVVDASPLASSTNLTRLYMGNNQLDSLSALAGLTALRFVNLGHNQITDVTAITGLTQLTEAYLNDNQIVDVSALASLINLEVVDLRNNAIGGEQVGNIDSLVSLSKAKSILLAGNDNIACVELSTLVAGLGANIVDIGANAQSIDCAQVPQAPRNLRVSAGDQRTIVTWDNVINAERYNIYWSNSPGVTIADGAAGVTKIANARSGYQHTALTNGLTYYYVVSAENASGESGASQEVSAVPQQMTIAGLFADANLQACMDELAAFKGWTTADQVSGVVNCSARAISSVAGVEHLSGVSTLSLNENNISDISPIGYLTNLHSLSLYRNNISSIDALANMAALNGLFVSNNLISKVHTLGGLSQLQVLDVRSNKIGTNGSGGVDQLTALNNATLISVAENPNMSCVELQNLLAGLGANVVDVKSAVAGQNCTLPSLAPTGIQAVGGDGQISISWKEVAAASGYNLYWSTTSGVTPGNGQKIPVNTLHYMHTGLDNNATYYYIVTSQLSGGESAPSAEIAAQPSANGVPLTGLFPDSELADCVRALAAAHGWLYALEISGTLNCSAQQIVDLSGMEQLKNLQVLRLGSNAIEDITPLATLTKLTFLDLYHNAISDIGALSNLTSLRTLYLHNNTITDITPLANLTNLDYLILDENDISDATPLSGLTGLTRLFFRSNSLADISALTLLTQLSELYLNNNAITNVGALSAMVYLQQLDIRNNQIGAQGAGGVDSLATLTNVSKIRLSGNPQLSCNELTSLIATLGPNSTDLTEAQPGVNCQAP